ncbi:MAG: DUF1801 domain-containing protein [Gemmatimonadota bacterium]
MATKRAKTIAEYIAAAPTVRRPHLKQIYKILKSVAPDAEEAIKWGNPFFIEPRFLFAFSAHKAHVSLAPSAKALKAFAKELEKYQTTDNFLKLPYDEPVPEKLVRKLAEFQVKALRARKDENFW